MTDMTIMVSTVTAVVVVLLLWRPACWALSVLVHERWPVGVVPAFGLVVWGVSYL